MTTIDGAAVPLPRRDVKLKLVKRTQHPRKLSSTRLTAASPSTVARRPERIRLGLTFAPDGATTRIEMRTVFLTRELRAEAVEKYHAIEGGQQTLSKLAAYVTKIVRKGVED
jgi:hypothetical protein